MQIKGKKTSTKSNSTSRKLTPREQTKNGTKKLTRTATRMIAKTPPGTTRQAFRGSVRFG